MSTRVYLPCSPHGLQAVVVAGGIGPAPLRVHAVTAAVRAEVPDGVEEQEHAAASAAASSSIGLLHDDEPARRVVLALDVPAVRLGGSHAGDPDATVVEVDEAVSWRQVAAVLADSADAEDAVSAAREALRQGSPDASQRVGRCLEHELGWWAAQEVEGLLGDLGVR